MMRKTAFLRTVALCLLAVLCLGSCGGEPTPPAVTTDTPATTEVPATTAAPEPMPEPIILCEDGASPYRIVISTTATKYEKNAADLVQQYFLALTGIRLPIVSDQQERIDTEIVVGNTKRDKYSGISVNRTVAEDALIHEEDSYRLVASRQRIFLYCLGDKDRNTTNRGTVYAAYRFIEEVLQFSIVYDRITENYKDLSFDRVVVPGDLDIESSSKSLSGAHIVDYPGETVMYMLPQANTSTQIGASMILKTADGKIMVIDGGYMGELDSITAAVKALTPEGKAPTIDAWVITHLHEDHADALLWYISRVEAKLDVGGLVIKEIWGHIMSKEWYEKANLAAYTDRGEILRNPPAPMKYVQLEKDQKIQFGDAEIEVLYVAVDNITTIMNNTSVVLKVTADKKSMVLLADAETLAGTMLIRKCTPAQLKADAVQIGHHGTVNVGKDVYQAIGAEIYLWPVTHKWWYCDDGTGLGTINAQYGTFDAMTLTRKWLLDLKVPMENIFFSFKGISAYHFNSSKTEYIS